MKIYSLSGTLTTWTVRVWTGHLVYDRLSGEQLQINFLGIRNGAGLVNWRLGDLPESTAAKE